MELIYLPFRIYKFQITLRRLFFKPLEIQYHLLLNGMNGQFTLVDLDYNELMEGLPKAKTKSFQFDVNKYDKKSEKELLFHLMKRYYLVFEPLITTKKAFNAYYPFWKYNNNEAVNGRSLIIESLNKNLN